MVLRIIQGLSLESVVRATVTAPGSGDQDCGQPSDGTLAIPAWAPSTAVGAGEAAPLSSRSTSGKDKEGTSVSHVETAADTPRESVESPAGPARLELVEGAAAEAAVAAAEVNDVVTQRGGIALPRSATATEGGGGGGTDEGGGAVSGDAGAGRVAAAEALAVELQAQIEEMEVTTRAPDCSTAV